MGLPAQTTRAWMESVRAAVGLGPEHLSLYILELYPNAPLREDMARAGWIQPPDDDAAEMYEAAMASLERQGYRQYEISNVARPGRESRHNLKYWRDGEWLGFGPGAHSTVAGQRWKNVPATGEWASRVEAGEPLDIERRVLTREERWQEALITGLRLAEGVHLGAFLADYGMDIGGRYAEELERFEEAGAVIRKAGRLRLTRRGMLVANEILRVFI
jgi:oxygen-independent coproporphyrinogen III oxidase